MRIKPKVWTALMVITSTAMVAGLVFGALFFLDVFHNGLENVSIPFFILAAFGFLLSLLILRRKMEQARERKALEEQNKYALGEATSFFDLYRFETVATSFKKLPMLKNKPQTLVAFTFAPISISSNPDHNDGIGKINFTISEYLNSFFVEENKNRQSELRRAAYCFSRGSFLLYLYIDANKTQTFCERLSKKIYEICGENKSKVLIQPFFGIYPTKADENISVAIENALLARSHSEEMFEMYTVYDPSFKVESNQSEIEEIESALENDEFIVYYQPKFSLKEKKFISSEALVRWNSPKHGLLSPVSFIERAEHAGLISQIDLYVFEKTLKDLAEMRARGHRTLPVSVNFSLYEFFSPSFLDVFMGLMEKYKVPPTLVEVEITETTSQANQFMSIQIIKRLKDKGVRVLMDDFGIGYSGIDNLRKIPFDAIKIDKSFTDLIVEDEKTRSIVKLIVELGHLNDIEVIIEGVDSQEQVDILRKMRMDTIQGFYYSRPIPFDQYEALLRENAFEASKGGKK